MKRVFRNNNGKIALDYYYCESNPDVRVYPNLGVGNWRKKRVGYLLKFNGTTLRTTTLKSAADFIKTTMKYITI